ncbi:MAG: DUF58 domain-containing protein [Deltaproteobacteria bacterium]|nr:DUF58 domain-containing protein [Myxococcales bacterium]MDP3218387.1 DUF58 domain-containing protein [Deltaproteobacteria bacterium]
MSPPRAGSVVLLVARVLFHTALLAALPFIVGGLAGFFAEVSQVSETLPRLIERASVVLLPLQVTQGVCVFVKVRRELSLTDAAPTARAVLESALRHTQVMTDKGLGLFFGALAAVVLSLTLKFAELGIIAVLGLATLYAVVTTGVLLSTVVAQRFEERLAARGGIIGREFVPVVVESGESVEELFHFERVPVPWGFVVQVHQRLPARLATESRHVVGAAVSMRRVTLSRPVHRTPRGDYRIPPASVAFTDLFGLTRVAIAQAAEARLRVLPRLHPVAMAAAPRSPAPQEGALAVLRRAPTEDWFRVREYLPGDDTRRIHWKLSVKLGHLQVRQPETVPVVRRRVRLVLDNHLPRSYAHGEEVDLVLGDVLDRLVELWISLARTLSERGESVQIAVATGDPARPAETLELTRGAQPRLLELGSRVEWQSETDFHQASEGLEKGQAVVVVTARFLPLPPLPPPAAGTVTWVFLPVAEEIPTAVPRRAVEKLLAFFTQPFAPGAEENALLASARRGNARRRLETVRANTAHLTAEGSAAAEATLRARGEPFYRVSRSGVAYLLG